MTTLASQLSNQYEYAIVVWGQSNARPWGIRDYEGFVAEPGMALASPGQDLKLVSVASSTVVVADTLETNSLVGATICFSRTRYGSSAYAFRKGYGTVTANTSSTLTVTWTVTPAAGPGTTPTTVTASGSTLTKTAHGLQTGDWFSPTDSGITGLTSGTWYVVTSVPTADTFQVSATWAGAAIAVSGSGDGLFAWGGSVTRTSAYRESRQVKVLTPYQPETPGAYGTFYPLESQGTWPASVTSAEDAALWLPLTWNEGFDGVGLLTTATSVTTSPALAANLPGWADPGDYIGATVHYYADNRVYYGTVATNAAANAITVAWTGATPSAAAGTMRVFWPHWRDNPNALRKGFRYPNVDMQPGSAVGFPGGHASATGAMYDRHAGIVKSAYTPNDDLTAGSKPWFGMVYPLAWRLSAQLGRPVHVIHLGINSTSLYPQTRPVEESYKGQFGWFTQDKNTWSPAVENSLADRLKDLITVLAPAAVTAQGGKPIRILGVVGMQGESDAISETGRTLYEKSLSSFTAWLRRTITEAGLSPYSTKAAVPVVHAKIGPLWRDPAYASIVDVDEDDVVNTAIQAVADADPFFETFSTDDSSRRTAADMHFDGYGEATNAQLASDALLSLVELALSSTRLDSGAVEICNVALAHIGDAAKVTSLEPPDGSAQAAYCARFYPVARDQLLEMMSWAFASRRAVLTQVENDSQAWQYAYVLPNDALTVETVQAATSADDFTYGLQTDEIGYDLSRFQSAQPFVIERNASGLRVIRTNQPPDAVARYTARVVDTSQYPQLFSLALSWSLAAMLAGPLVKGADGAALAQRCTQMMGVYLQQARSRDGQQRKVPVPHSVSWIQGR